MTQLSKARSHLSQLTDEQLVSLWNRQSYTQNDGAESIYTIDETGINQAFSSAWDATRAIAYATGNPNLQHKYFTLDKAGNMVTFQKPRSLKSPYNKQTMLDWMVDNPKEWAGE